LHAALLLTIGKYLFVALVYLFALMVFRGMMRELARTSSQPQHQATRPAAPPVRQQPAPAQAPAAVATPPPGQAPQPAPAPPAQSRLLVIRAAEGNTGLGPEIALSAAVTFGRSAENSVTLDDRYVSGEHAQIYLHDGRRVLLDRGSTNGTLLNGRPVEGEVELGDGDQISIGQSVFEYRA